ncbi:hypothetical protein ACSNOI_37725 [Actinomadura kijaniata]|uniref:hypothetical protein n=1 Tax=Actinomadura kijaniata TaxID=46161 RepID=UPI003F1A1BCE
MYQYRPYLNEWEFDPHRVGGPGQPPWPGSAINGEEFQFLTTVDARLGTFDLYVEQNFVVFGEGLLPPISAPSFLLSRWWAIVRRLGADHARRHLCARELRKRRGSGRPVTGDLTNAGFDISLQGHHPELSPPQRAMVGRGMSETER